MFAQKVFCCPKDKTCILLCADPVVPTLYPYRTRKPERDEGDKKVGTPLCTPFKIRYGKHTCTEGFQLGTLCQIKCNKGLEMYGSSEISCQKTDGINALWTKKPPCCASRCNNNYGKTLETLPFNCCYVNFQAIGVELEFRFRWFVEQNFKIQ